MNINKIVVVLCALCNVRCRYYSTNVFNQKQPKLSRFSNNDNYIKKYTMKEIEKETLNLENKNKKIKPRKKIK